MKVWQLLGPRLPGTTGHAFVHWRDGWLLPYPCSARIDDDQCPYHVEVELEVVDGRVECTAARFIQRKGGPPVSPRLIRTVPLTAYVKAAIAELVLSDEEMITRGLPDPSASGRRATARFAAETFDEEGRKRGRRPLDRAHLEAVAKVFREAEIAGEPPRRAVERDRRWGPVGPSVAARWIRAARDADLLDEPKKKGT